MFCASPYTLPVSQSSGMRPSWPDSLARVDGFDSPKSPISTGSSLALALDVVLRFHSNEARVEPTAAAWGDESGSIRNFLDPAALRA